MTILVYVNTSKQVGAVDHIKLSANQDAAESGSRRTTSRAWRLSMKFWSECAASKAEFIRLCKLPSESSNPACEKFH